MQRSIMWELNSQPVHRDTRLLLLVYPSSSLGWRYGANSNPGSHHQPNQVRLGESDSPFRTSRGCKLPTGSPTTNKADCHWWVPKNRSTCWVNSFTTHPACRKRRLLGTRQYRYSVVAVVEAVTVTRYSLG